MELVERVPRAMLPKLAALVGFAFGHSQGRTCLCLLDLVGTHTQAGPSPGVRFFPLPGQQGQCLLDDCGRQKKTVTIQSVDSQYVSSKTIDKRGPIVGKGWSHLRGELQDARLGQRRQY